MAGFLSRSLPASLVWLSHWSSFKSEAGSGAASHVQQTVAVCKPNAWPRVPRVHLPHTTHTLLPLSTALPRASPCLPQLCRDGRPPHFLPQHSIHLLPFLLTLPHACPRCRYAETVIHRIFYHNNRLGDGRISWREFRRQGGEWAALVEKCVCCRGSCTAPFQA